MLGHQNPGQTENPRRKGSTKTRLWSLPSQLWTGSGALLGPQQCLGTRLLNSSAQQVTSLMRSSPFSSQKGLVRPEMAQAPLIPFCHTNGIVFPLCAQNGKGWRPQDKGREEGAGIWEAGLLFPPCSLDRAGMAQAWPQAQGSHHCFLISPCHFSLPLLGLCLLLLLSTSLSLSPSPCLCFCLHFCVSLPLGLSAASLFIPHCLSDSVSLSSFCL